MSSSSSPLTFNPLLSSSQSSSHAAACTTHQHHTASGKTCACHLEDLATKDTQSSNNSDHLDSTEDFCEESASDMAKNKKSSSKKTVAKSKTTPIPSNLRIEVTNEDSIPAPSQSKALNAKQKAIADVEARYVELIERKNLLRTKSKSDEADLIQAAISVGFMLGWTKLAFFRHLRRARREPVARSW